MQRHHPLLLLALLVFAVAARTPAATFVVVSTDDDGPGTLRQAIVDANAAAGTDAIEFNIPVAGVPTIIPATPLPAITDPVAIDGTKQPAPAGRVELSGEAGLSGGLEVTATGAPSTIRGLVVNRFVDYGIRLSGGSGNVIETCWIGLAATGLTRVGAMGIGIHVSDSQANRIGGSTAARNVLAGSVTNLRIEGNSAQNNVVQSNFIGVSTTGGLLGPTGSLQGIQLTGGAKDNRIGGTTTATRNVISGHGTPNAAGIELTDSTTQGNLITGNYVGTDPSGGSSRPNFTGILIMQALGNTIGGGTAGSGNVIASSLADGIKIKDIGSLSNPNTIQGNLIGLNAAGTAALANGGSGIRIEGGLGGSVVGGSAPLAANTIAGNNADGILIATNNQVVDGNRIGVRLDGVTPQANRFHGILIQSSNNVIGGDVGNTIAHNGEDGVFVFGGIHNTVRRNRIHDNGGLGIDVGAGGVTLNDPGDADGVTNFPVLVPGLDVGATSVTVSLDAKPNELYTIEVFSSADCDPSGQGEGEGLTGTAQVTTDAGGHAEAMVELAVPVDMGRVLTATATDSLGSTSELSACTLPAGATTTTTTTTTTSTSSTGLPTTTVRTTTTRPPRTTTTLRVTTTTTFGPLGPDEVCDDGADNDGDGVVDCADLNCRYAAPCIAGDCPPGGTVDAAGCRLGAFADRVTSAGDLGRLRARLARRLVRARTALRRAEETCAAGKLAPARAALRRAAQQLRAVDNVLHGRAGRLSLPSTTIAALTTETGRLREELLALRNSLSCS